MTLRALLSLASLLPCATLASAQVDYRLSFQPDVSVWKVEARFPGRGEMSHHFWIPLWTPGAYHVAEYARFVDSLTASDQDGAPLKVERPETSHFILRGAEKAKEVVVSYAARSISTETFSNNIIDVESNRITESYAYVNPVSLFGFVPERAQEPVTLALELPEGWDAATVLEQDDDGRFLAPSYYRFEDSPFLFSPNMITVEFLVDEKPHRVSVHGKGMDDVQTLAAGCQKIVAAGSRLMQGLPYEHYHFLFGFVDEASGSGLEHSYSTLILVNSSTTVAEETDSLWNITAHEFFHLWCAERIHVQEIHAPDLTQPLETGTIWVNEGITEYFSRHLLLHAGFLDEGEFFATFMRGAALKGLAGDRSWTGVSRAASDWSGMQDLMQFAMRMYMLGPPTILALDLELRRASGGERGVLDLLRTLRWAYVEADRGFGENEMPAILNGVAQADMGEFYRRFIDGAEIPDLASYLGVIGYRIEGGQAVPIEGASEEQLAARRDFLSADGRP